MPFVKPFIAFLIVSLTMLNASEGYKEKKIYPMGEKVYKARCQQTIDPNSYKTIDELKKDIKEKKLCKPLKEKHFEALSLYLWDVKRVGTVKTHKDVIKVSKDEKCPVCGMFIYKYPRWAAQMDEYYFDGVKDMMKFYFDSDKNFKKMLVTDYYTQEAIDATKAYFVIGSDVYGPMGNELIPFEKESDAKTFNIDHGGHKSVKFGEITEQEVYKLDE